jgi:hypothetical protein
MRGIEFNCAEYLSRPYRAVVGCVNDSRACGPGYNITGFQPGHAAPDAGSLPRTRSKGAEVLGNSKWSLSKAERALQ